MNIISRHARKPLLAITMAGTLFAFSPACPAAGAQKSQNAASAAKTNLQGSQFKNVQVIVDGKGLATLTGTVANYEDKVDAGRAAQHALGVTAVRNEIQVGGPKVPDSKIEKTLGPELAYDGENHGSPFDAIIMHVQGGVVTLSGHADSYPDRDAAVGLASTTPGVKEVIDNIHVDPSSKGDWKVRMGVARAIYSYPALEKYATNPIRPIRIAVQNGHVELYGTVDSRQDKQLAYTRSEAVPGVFSVKNYLTVEGQTTHKK